MGPGTHLQTAWLYKPDFLWKEEAGVLLVPDNRWDNLEQIASYCFLRCFFNDNSMPTHLLDFGDVTLMPPWAKSPYRAQEDRIPSPITGEGSTAASAWKAKVWKRRGAFPRHALHFKGQGCGFEKLNNFSEAWFCLCCRGIYCSKISWHLGSVGRAALCKKEKKRSSEEL